MTLRVEDGTIVANANGYVTLDEFRSFFEDRGYTAIADGTGNFTDDNCEAAIVKATDYVDKRWGMKFKGWRTDEDQTLQWPRTGVIDQSQFLIEDDVIPRHLKNAVYEYARLAIALAELLPVPAPNFNKLDPDTGESIASAGGPLFRERVVVGPIEDEKWYADPTKLELSGRASGVTSDMVSTINLPEYPVADEWLRQLVEAGTPMTIERG